MMQEKDRREDLPLSKAALYLLEECRMVLPGMQALFGFQLISVFSDTFSKSLSENEQLFHLVALGLVAIGVALVMTPAAIHRYTGGRIVTDKFVDQSTQLLILSMYPLLVGICIDFYLIARMITKSPEISLTITLVLFVIFLFLWAIFPRIGHRYHKEA
jgi:hypothetical protein